MWTRNENCAKIVANAWKDTQATVENITKRTTKVCDSLMKWNKEEFGQFEVNLSNLEKQLQQLNERALDDFIQQQIKETKKSIVKWQHREEIFWKQQSRISWLNEGGRIT